MLNVADLKNPETGLTYREENQAKTHAIPLGALVEINPMDYSEDGGLRLFVVAHTRDCDQTPLYALSHYPVAEYLEIQDNLKGPFPADMPGLKSYFKGRAHSAGINGYSNESLTVIRLPSEINHEQ